MGNLECKGIRLEERKESAKILNYDLKSRVNEVKQFAYKNIEAFRRAFQIPILDFPQGGA